MSSSEAIELDGVGVYRSQRWILRDVSWHVPAGSCAAILGPNGGGKSTLARIIGGHLFPTDGTCSVLGETFGQTDLGELRRRIRLLQPAGPYDIDVELTALEAVLTGYFSTLTLYDTPTAEMTAEAARLLERVGLGMVENHPYRTLSSGERIRTLIARALVRRPEILLLDEPTSGLDLLAREQILATVQAMFEDGEWRPTVLMITHHVEELPPATGQVLLLAGGRVAAAGRPEDVLTESTLSDVYGCPVQVRLSGGRFYVEVHPSAWEELVRRRS